jgi:uncharacterized protein YegP (UPF0339 family)
MKRPLTLEFIQSRRNRQWRWRIKGGNGEIVGHGECHPTKAKAKRSIDNVLAAIASGRVKNK